MCEKCEELKKVMKKKADEMSKELEGRDPLKDENRYRLDFMGGYAEALRFFYSYL